jgi:WD40 repeat protein
MPELNQRPNPYVGPRAFQTGEKLYGRDHEVRDLLDLLIAERIVLLHSPSGAGKSSLVQAGLIPCLQEDGFDVLPVIRLNLDPPAALRQETGFNRYVFSALLSLEERQPEAQQLPLEKLAGMSLEDYLTAHPQRSDSNGADGPPPNVFIFDQFEEVLTIDATDREAKLEFFYQLGAALRDRRRWALFSMREDYLASLEPYLRPIPTRLGNTFRLDFLEVPAARQAIQQPVNEAGVSFTDPAVAKLVNDLRQVQVQEPDGTMKRQPGLYVEPVQLQVACYHLWQNLAEDKTQITEDDISAIGNVDQSLAEYYAEQVAAVAQAAEVKERGIREWFEHHLITEGGIRGQVLMEPEMSKGLANRAIRALEDTHLIRAEKRLGATWFELAHDRLIQPVRQNNAEWFQANLSLLQRQASLWEREKRLEHYLLREEALAEAEAWAATHPDELTSVEIDFLNESRKIRIREQEKRAAAEQAVKLEAAEKVAEAERKRAEEQARSARLLRRRAILLAVLLLVAVGLAGAAGYLGNQANLNAQKAQFERNNAVVQQNTAVAASFLADEQRRTAEAASVIANQQKATAEAASGVASTARALEAEQRKKAEAEANLRATAEVVALEQRDIALSRQRAAVALSYLDVQTDLSLLLSIEAYRTSTTTLEGKSALLTTLQRGLSRKLERFQIPSSTRSVYSVSLSPDSQHLAWASEDGTITLWNYQDSSSTILSGHSARLWSVTYSPDGTKLASGGDDSSIIIWNVASGMKLETLENGNKVQSLSWSPDNQHLAAAVGPHVVIWDTTAKTNIDRLIGYDINSVSWSPDGKKIAAASSNFIVYIIDPLTGNTTNQLTGHQKQVNCVAWAPDSKLLASGGEDYKVFLWNSAAGTHEEMLPNFTDNVLSCAFSFDGALLAAGSDDNDKTVNLWDVQTRKLLDQIKDNSRSVQSVTFIPKAGDVLLASGSRDTRVGLYKVITEQPLSEPLPDAKAPLVALGQASDGTTLVASYAANILNVDKLDGNALQPVADNLSHVKAVTSAAFSPDGRQIAFSTEGGEIKLVDLATGEDVSTLRGAPQPVASLAFGRQMIAAGYCSVSVEGGTACSQSEIMLWDVASGQPRSQPLKGQSGLVEALAFSPDELTLASGSSDHTILLWNLITNTPQGLPLNRHVEAVTSLAFSPDGKTLASGSADQTLILWDVATSQPIGRPLTGFTGDVLSLVFGRDREHLYAGTQDKKFLRWDVSDTLWIDRACSLARRNLSLAEWQQYIPNKPYSKTCDQWPAGQ